MEQLDDKSKIEKIASNIREIIELLGEDPAREGLLKTPVRAAKALWFLTSGYRCEPASIMREALFDHEGSRMVIVKDIEFYSMCEHHILPFFGKVSIGYVPSGKIVGLSKMARIVNAFARRLQVQERFTAELCTEIRRATGAAGVIVVCNAQHLCMKMRGVEKQESSTSSVEYNGCFEVVPNMRKVFFDSMRSF